MLALQYQAPKKELANPEHLAILKQGSEAWNQWRRANPDTAPDLREADLRGMRLKEADLRGAVLRKAQLNEADLHGADLSQADLREANLGQVDLGAAKLRNADFQGADFYEANLGRADARGANLSGADLFKADLRAANLSGADLHGAKLFKAELCDANLTGANLAEAFLVETDFSEAYLHGASLRGAELVKTKLSKTDLSAADLREAVLYEALFQSANLIEANLSQAELRETVFIDTDLSNATGLETCVHRGPSTVDHRTLQRSFNLSKAFLLGCRLPDYWIDFLYLPPKMERAVKSIRIGIGGQWSADEFSGALTSLSDLYYLKLVLELMYECLPLEQDSRQVSRRPLFYLRRILLNQLPSLIQGQLAQLAELVDFKERLQLRRVQCGPSGSIDIAGTGVVITHVEELLTALIESRYPLEAQRPDSPQMPPIVLNDNVLERLKFSDQQKDRLVSQIVSLQQSLKRLVDQGKIQYVEDLLQEA